MKEEFKSIGCGYHVSNKGRVFKYIHGKRFFLAHNPDSGGYYKVKLRLSDGKQKNFFVHRLVAMAFIHKPKDKEYVDHKDCNPKNNCVDNLRWVTAYENAHNRNTRKHVRIAAKTMTRYTVAICRISSSGYVKKYPSIKSAVKDGYFSGSIYKCLRGQMKTHRGYRWAYQS